MQKRVRVPLVGLVALASLGLASPSATAHDDTGTSRLEVKQGGHVKRVVGCYFDARPPGYLTRNTIAASGGITSCTTPKPDACRFQTSLMVGVSTIAHKDTGWKSCKKRTNKITHKCANLVQKRTYYTESILQIEYQGRYATNRGLTGKDKLYCG